MAKRSLPQEYHPKIIIKVTPTHGGQNRSTQGHHYKVIFTKSSQTGQKLCHHQASSPKIIIKETPTHGCQNRSTQGHHHKVIFTKSSQTGHQLGVITKVIITTGQKQVITHSKHYVKTGHHHKIIITNRSKTESHPHPPNPPNQTLPRDPPPPLPPWPSTHLEPVGLLVAPLASRFLSLPRTHALDPPASPRPLTPRTRWNEICALKRPSWGVWAAGRAGGGRRAVGGGGVALVGAVEGGDGVDAVLLDVFRRKKNNNNNEETTRALYHAEHTFPRQALGFLPSACPAHFPSAFEEGYRGERGSRVTLRGRMSRHHATSGWVARCLFRFWDVNNGVLVYHVRGGGTPLPPPPAPSLNPPSPAPFKPPPAPSLSRPLPNPNTRPSLTPQPPSLNPPPQPLPPLPKPLLSPFPKPPLPQPPPL
ncbi:hypothetical protein C7M84_017237 [Penaeus vannamei]|uniref:Uncharacterized protein n=1 Tax=Penaeus vannamei TaxID=6689 RepID=A0A3R7PFI1_PENVA|nr:hypothetical protein C7M84_017237 [Penaeus vannamei]